MLIHILIALCVPDPTSGMDHDWEDGSPSSDCPRHPRNVKWQGSRPTSHLSQQVVQLARWLSSDKKGGCGLRDIAITSTHPPLEWKTLDVRQEKTWLQLQVIRFVRSDAGKST